MLTSILVPVDSSPHSRAALEHAVELGKAYRARLTGLYVLDVRYLEMPPYLDYSFTFEAIPPSIAPLDILEKFRVKSERLLNDFHEVVERAGLSAEVRTEEGVPSHSIVETGAAHDLIVMGKRGEHAKWGGDLLGSTAENVVRRSATPVFLVDSEHRPLRKMLVLFDGSYPANRALKLAADLSARTAAKLKILTVDDDAARGTALQQEAKSYLEPLRLGAIYDLLSGRAAKTIASALEDEPVDAVILGMRGHSALHDLILGSTAEHLMRSVQVPVLLVP
jgi:nucleotide-binding universal stress UspA family protein